MEEVRQPETHFTTTQANSAIMQALPSWTETSNWSQETMIDGSLPAFFLAIPPLDLFQQEHPCI
jgi:hypothetical protein